MRLAEALIERAEIQKLNAQLISRIESNAKVQEGDEPSENPQNLLDEYKANMERLLYLVQKINLTNSANSFDEKQTMSDAIARRDSIKSQIKALRRITDEMQITQNRYSSTEIRFVRCLDVKVIQVQIDNLSKQYRQIDTHLQELNWTTDLKE